RAINPRHSVLGGERAVWLPRFFEPRCLAASPSAVAGDRYPPAPLADIEHHPRHCHRLALKAESLASCRRRSIAGHIRDATTHNRTHFLFEFIEWMTSEIQAECFALPLQPDAAAPFRQHFCFEYGSRLGRRIVQTEQVVLSHHACAGR